MPSWNAFSYAFGPLFAAVPIVILVLILRWSHRRGSSVVAAPARPGTRDDYGLLVPVGTPATYIEGEVQRRALEEQGIRTTLATTLEGPTLLVWPQDAERAAAFLARKR